MLFRHRFIYFLLVIIFFYLDAYSQKTRTLIQSVDSVIAQGIKEKAFPGCVILVARADEMVFHRSYGYHTYDSVRQVKPDDIYDLASITKVLGGTLALMKLYDERKIHLDDPIGHYIKGLGNKKKLTIRECLAHQAGLTPWIPFYKKIKNNRGKYSSKTLSHTRSAEFDFKLNDHLYLHRGFYQKIKKLIKKSTLNQKKTYKYSGLFFYLIPEIVKKLSGLNMDEYLAIHFYKKLGMNHTFFLNKDTSFLDQIVPTEIDSFFRMKKIHGEVHDEGAILMRGVSANAGLFSNAMDLWKISRMLVHQGKIDTLNLLNPHTIELFTTIQYPNNDNRRALGFDKPLIDYDPILTSVAKLASMRSYGHTGFTGSMWWMDPEDNIIFIFLTNRVYPTRKQKNIYTLNIRPTIHQFIYDHLLPHTSH